MIPSDSNSVVEQKSTLEFATNNPSNKIIKNQSVHQVKSKGEFRSSFFMQPSILAKSVKSSKISKTNTSSKKEMSEAEIIQEMKNLKTALKIKKGRIIIK